LQLEFLSAIMPHGPDSGKARGGSGGGEYFR
jgi:hypothetical protein